VEETWTCLRVLNTTEAHGQLIAPMGVLDKDAVVIPLCEDEVWKFSQRNKYKLI
jgi:hypothetical protein